jgi:hypothetical protein
MTFAIGLILKFVPVKLQIAALVVVVVALAFVGVHWMGGRNAIVKVEAKRDRDRLASFKLKQEVDEDVSNSDRADVISDITRR